MSARGIALVLVLWALVALAAIAAAAGASSRAELQLTANAVDLARAEQLADAGVHLALAQLLGTPPEPDPDGVLRLRFALEGVPIAVESYDETGKVDLNLAPQPLLLAALQAAGLGTLEAERLAAAIQDWRDADDRRRLTGAEAFEYRAAGLPQRPRNADFARLDELRQVLGMTPALFARLAPFVTVTGNAATIDPLRAPPALLAAVPGLDTLAMNRIMDAREEPGARRFPAGPVGELLAPSHGLAHTIVATVALPGGIRFRREALVWLTDRADRPFLILDWRAPAIADAAALAGGSAQ